VRPTKLFSKNKDVESYNQAQFSALTTELVTFEAADGGCEPYRGDFFQGLRVPEKLELRVGAQVMLLKNLDIRQGLVNGAR
jgi:ATP-dependent DNA helicase PIF1